MCVLAASARFVIGDERRKFAAQKSISGCRDCGTWVTPEPRERERRIALWAMAITTVFGFVLLYKAVLDDHNLRVDE